jgi:seryl-tRNA synthetase
LPNVLDEVVPTGLDEADNEELRVVGTPPAFPFLAKPHFELGEALGLMDFETAAEISGSRFVILKGALARMERALADFMLDVQTEEFGYTEVSPPLLVREEVLFGTGQLPKFGDDLFRTTDNRWLIPTAEVPLTNMVAGKILDDSELPVRLTAHTACFRAEAGAAGKDTRGMLRQHQFYKVELVSIVRPEESETELERMTGCAEEILKRLGLAYRVVLLCSGDTGFGAARTHDLEVWMPGQDTYREISSVSNTRAFQARRMNARYRPSAEGQGLEHVHTLNGSGVAIGRALIAVLENYQNADGSITIPEALRPYMGGLEMIPANA